MKTLHVKDTLASRQSPPCLEPAAPLPKVWHALRKAGVNDLVVTSDGTPTGTLVGVLSAETLVERGLVETSAGVCLSPDRVASDVLIATPQPATEDSDLDWVLATMRELGVTALPLVQGGRLVGVVTETAVLQAVERRLRQGPQQLTSEDRVEDALEDALEDVEVGMANPLWANFMQLLSEAGI